MKFMIWLPLHKLAFDLEYLWLTSDVRNRFVKALPNDDFPCSQIS